MSDASPVLDEDTGDYYHVVYALGGGALFGSGLSFRDPDNLPLEFFAPPS